MLYQVEAPLDPTKELARLISERKYEEAFIAALHRSDVSIVSWLCAQVCQRMMFSLFCDVSCCCCAMCNWPLRESLHFCQAGWFTWTFVEGSSSFKPRCIAFPSAAVGLWYQQRPTQKDRVDDRCGCCHRSLRSHDFSARTTHLWASLSDTESSTERADNDWGWSLKYPSFVACHQLYAHDM